jgi:hypothetical protein
MTAAAKFILLHLVCTVCKPKTWRFHLAGIFREFVRMVPTVPHVPSNPTVAPSLRLPSYSS